MMMVVVECAVCELAAQERFFGSWERCSILKKVKTRHIFAREKRKKW